MGGYIMQLQNFSVNDGEGIRTIIFMAGCPLRCAWCANPEGQTMENPMTHWSETEDILAEIRRQSIFYRFSSGGVTFSGGEATFQPEFLRELTDALYDEGFDLTIETCGQFDFEKLTPILKKMSLIFIDLKHIDSEAHRKLTGVDNELILKNIRKTASLNIPVVVRIPVILGANGDDDAMRRAFYFLQSNAPHASLELLPYHRFGEEKYKQLGMRPPDAAFDIPSRELLERWTDEAHTLGINIADYR